MSLPRFHVSQPLATSEQQYLNSDQSHQVRSTLRLRPGDPVIVFDGSGAEGQAVVTSMKKDSVSYEIRSISTPAREPMLKLRVGLALLRGERFDLAVQKLTELGVARITPLAADRCVVSFPVAADWERRAGRLLRVAREAAEQSERVTIPHIDRPMPLAEFLRSELAICLVERTDDPPLVALPLNGAMSLALGPEGGWSANERDAMRAVQAIEAGLGKLILRAETAAIVSAGTLLQRAWHEL